MKKVLYILSFGHSGSTLLDITLGQFKNTLSTGELIHLTWQYYRQITNNPTVQKCTCGATFDECNIWGSVINDIAKYKNISNELVPHDFSIKYFDDLSFFSNSKKDFLLRFIYQLNLYFPVIPMKLFHFYFKNINGNNIKLYDSIFDNSSDIDYIIDSSKDIIKYNELKNSVNIFPIILVRNLNEVLKSDYLNDKKNWRFRWKLYYNYFCLPMVKGLCDNDFHIISYDEFISNPEKVIKQLAKKVNINMNEFSTTISMKNHHVVAGNPMRYSDKITIKQKELSKGKLLVDLKESGLDDYFISRI